METKYYAQLSLPRMIEEAPFDPIQSCGAIVIIRKPPPESEGWKEVGWRQWLYGPAPCPFVVFNTVTAEWQAPAAVHTYGWIISKKTLVKPRPCQTPYVYLHLSDADARRWRRAAPQPEDVLSGLGLADKDSTLAYHYHPESRLTKLRAARVIKAGERILAGDDDRWSMLYAYDARDHRYATVSADGTLLRDVRPGQPLILQPAQPLPAAPAKRQRLLSSPSVLLDQASIVDNVGGAFGIVKIGCEILIKIKNATLGRTVEVPIRPIDDTWPPLKPHLLYPLGRAYIVGKHSKGRGSTMHVIDPNGTQLDMPAKQAEKLYPDAFADFADTGGFQGVATCSKPRGNKTVITSFVHSAPTAYEDLADVVIARATVDESGSYTMNVPLGRTGLLYCFSHIAAGYDKMREEALPYKLNSKNSFYCEAAATVALLPADRGWKWATLDQAAPTLIRSHLCLNSAQVVPAIPFKHPTTGKFEYTAMCAKLTAAAPGLLALAIGPWGSSALKRSVRIDVGADGLASLPVDRAMDLKLNAAKHNKRYVFVGYTKSGFAAEAVGTCEGRAMVNRAGSAGSIWPAFICEF